MTRLKPTKAPSRFEGVFQAHEGFEADSEIASATSFTKACYARLFPPVGIGNGRMADAMPPPVSLSTVGKGKRGCESHQA